MVDDWSSIVGCGNSTCLSNAAGGEHVTVISGTFNLGMGEKVDKSGGRALSAGAFAFMPPGMRHFAWTTGETVIQLHGTGPWKINYVNPADDPRKTKQ